MDPRINRLRMFIGLLALLAIVYAACTTIVRDGQSALVINLGKPSKVLKEPGLHWTLPWPIEQTVFIDMRKRSMHTQHTEMLTKDKKNVVLLSYVLWSVESPLKFYQAIGNIIDAENKLQGLVTNAKIGVLGKYELSALASTNPESLKMEAIEKELLSLTRSVALEKYGIALHSIGFSRLSLPKENIKSVFKQMRAERRKFSVEFQVEGEKAAGKIRADTDLEVARIQAETSKEVAKILGDAEAQAAQIYAVAHSKDPDLYRFVRSLDTIDKVIGARSTIILRTDSEPFHLLASPQ